jgi:hypothetical protein
MSLQAYQTNEAPEAGATDNLKALIAQGGNVLLLHPGFFGEIVPGTDQGIQERGCKPDSVTALGKQAQALTENIKRMANECHLSSLKRHGVNTPWQLRVFLR